jgi:hypothetical protein
MIGLTTGPEDEKNRIISQEILQSSSGELVNSREVVLANALTRWVGNVSLESILDVAEALD